MDNLLKEFVNSEVWHLYEPYAISLLLGGLIGIEREFKKQRERKIFFGGVRTFILISLLGTLSGALSQHFGLPVVFISLLALSGLIGISLILERAPGLTSEISGLLTFLIGLLCSNRNYQLASFLSISLLFVLSFKEQMHKFVKHLTLEDLYAFLKFAAVTFVVYPLLPDRAFYGVNPREVWTMVVVISGIDFLGYVLTKIAGERGVVITGLIGGLVSSTAVTATFSPLSKINPHLLREYASGIVGASSIMFPRMVVLASVVNLKFAKYLLIPSLTAFILGIAYSYVISKHKTQNRANVKVTNPFELSTAIKFGLFYALILFLARNAIKYFGNYGLYVVASISGLSDVDAITLSTAKLYSSGIVEIFAGIFAVLLAAFVNTVFKWFLTGFMGTKELFKLTAPGFILLTVGEVLGLVGLIVYLKH
jgi:uncharacterized membrane protein (DUF4010 family)